MCEYYNREATYGEYTPDQLKKRKSNKMRDPNEPKLRTEESTSAQLDMLVKMRLLLNKISGVHVSKVNNIVYRIGYDYTTPHKELLDVMRIMSDTYGDKFNWSEPASCGDAIYVNLLGIEND